MSNPGMTTTNVRVVAPGAAEDIGRLAGTLAAAFQNDPVFTWWIVDPGERRAILPGFFRILAEANAVDGQVHLEEHGVCGAVWSPPEAPDRTEAVGPVLDELAGNHADRLFEVFELMAARHPTDPHEYLFFVGTRPEWQSRGLGSAVMRPVLERCDRERLPAYLEATCEDNVRLYLRHGFEITGTIELPDGPSLTCMRREPR